MVEGQTGYSGIVDVSIIVPSLFENPLRIEALDFLESVLNGRVKALLPTSVFFGAYHVTVRYLHCPRDLIAQQIKETISVGAPAFLEDISIELLVEALDIASIYNIESWDGYLVSLARSFGAPIIYSLDTGFKKVPDITLVSPFKKEKVREYNNWLSSLGEGRK